MQSLRRGCPISDRGDQQQHAFRQLCRQVIDERAYRGEKAAPIGTESRSTHAPQTLPHPYGNLLAIAVWLDSSSGKGTTGGKS
jgi:hypothetical protein